MSTMVVVAAILVVGAVLSWGYWALLQHYNPFRDRDDDQDA